LKKTIYIKRYANNHKRNWIKKLLKQNLKPELIILEKVKIEEWEKAERKWIAHGWKNGWKLVNKTEGGASNYRRSMGSRDLRLQCIEALSLYIDEEKQEKLYDLDANILAKIVRRAALASADIFMGIGNGKRRDYRKAFKIELNIINQELNMLI